MPVGQYQPLEVSLPRADGAVPPRKAASEVSNRIFKPFCKDLTAGAEPGLFSPQSFTSSAPSKVDRIWPTAGIRTIGVV